jgi:hypothetical protein
MRKAVFTTFFLAFALLWVPGVYSQAPVQNPGSAAPAQRQRSSYFVGAPGNRVQKTASPQQAQPKPALPTPVPATPPQVQPQPQPEAPKKESVIEVKDDKLTVDVNNADLGAVMNQIGAKMHVPVQVSGAVYSRKISTKFSGLDIDRGLQRLLALAGERNYLIRYNETGAIGGIELYADNPTPSSGQSTPGLMSPRSRVSANPLFRRRYRRFTPPQPAQQRPPQPTVEQIGQ